MENELIIISNYDPVFNILSNLNLNLVVLLANHKIQGKNGIFCKWFFAEDVKEQNKNLLNEKEYLVYHPNGLVGTLQPVDEGGNIDKIFINSCRSDNKIPLI